MREIPFVRLQLYILGKCTLAVVLCVPVCVCQCVCADEACVNERRASAAARTPHSTQLTFYTHVFILGTTPGMFAHFGFHPAPEGVLCALFVSGPSGVARLCVARKG